jgi:hypothetical protein
MPKKIYCALCIHCKVFRVSTDNGKTFVRKVRCAQNQWPIKQGRHLTYDYRTLPRRKVDCCDYYEPDKCERSDQEVLGEIFDALPAKRRIHQGDG